MTTTVERSVLRERSRSSVRALAKIAVAHMFYTARTMSYTDTAAGFTSAYQDIIANTPLEDQNVIEAHIETVLERLADDLETEFMSEWFSCFPERPLHQFDGAMFGSMIEELKS